MSGLSSAGRRTAWSTLNGPVLRAAPRPLVMARVPSAISRCSFACASRAAGPPPAAVAALRISRSAARREMVVLRPQWLVDAFRRLITQGWQTARRLPRKSPQDAAKL